MSRKKRSWLSGEPAVEPAEPGAAGGAEAGDFPAGFELRPAWRRGDAQIERDAIAFWQRLDILPPDVKGEERAGELVAAAYQEGRLVGVTTASINRYPPLRARFAFLRGAVDPDARRSQVGTAMLLFSRQLLETWSAEHPEARVLGMAAIVETPDLALRQREPVWPRSQLNIAGYLDDGRQVRVSWFGHARLD